MELNNTKKTANITTRTPTHAISFFESLAWSLLLYSQRDNKFAQWLKEQNGKQMEKRPDLNYPFGVEVLIPRTRQDAIERTRWILDQIEKKTAAATETQKILAKVGTKT